MIIKILGSGCPKCKKLAASAQKAVQDSDVSATIEKVTDIKKIMDYGVMMTPALVIDEEVVSSGRVLSVEKIKELITE